MADQENEYPIQEEEVIKINKLVRELEGYVQEEYQFPPGANEIKELREQKLDAFLHTKGLPENELENTKLKIVEQIRAEEEKNKKTNNDYGISDLPPGAEI